MFKLGRIAGKITGVLVLLMCVIFASAGLLYAFKVLRDVWIGL
jgi:hypothetical protein